MTKVFVHGNPETDAIWGPLSDALAGHGVDDVVLLSPPGFGAPSPPGWDARPESYVAWLAGELERIGGDIDLIGHDWGAGHVFGLAAARPDLLRSVACDCAGLLHPDYVWHDMAQLWQTPDVGEETVAAMVGLPLDDRVAMYEGLGMSTDIAEAVASGMDDEMGRCVLALYRAAVQPALIELADRLAAASRPPMLILDATDDAYVGSELAPAVVERFGAEHHALTGQGHWWMISDPAGAAAALAEFWAGV